MPGRQHEPQPRRSPHHQQLDTWPRDITRTLENGDQGSLAVRDLLRGTATGLPSGEAVARQLGEAPLVRWGR
jgi:hypothetical protein